MNTVTGKLYVGSARNIPSRFRDHALRLRTRQHRSSRLQRSWDKHGAQAFRFEPLLICAIKDLVFYEQRAIDVLKPQYNLAPKAGSQLGFRHSAESIERIRAAKRNPSAELREKVSKTIRERMADPEYRARRLRGSASVLGMKHTDEAREVIRAAAKAQWADPEKRERNLAGQRRARST